MARRSVDGQHPLYGFNFITRYPKKPDLVTYLCELHENLSGLLQDVMSAPRGLPTTVSHLIATKLLEHSDKEVRVLVACCLVDVLRIYAPEAPYKDADMVRVFALLVAQLRSLNTVDPQSSLGKQVVYILQSLATVKSCVVPIILAQNNVPGAEELVVSLFESIVNAVGPEHSDEGEPLSLSMCCFKFACVLFCGHNEFYCHGFCG
jgi:sister chromatid cohesion protein PDS5